MATIVVSTYSENLYYKVKESIDEIIHNINSTMNNFIVLHLYDKLENRTVYLDKNNIISFYD